MSALTPLLLRRIREAGPMQLSDYMAECLLHPQHGYYTQAQVFGQAGDFITAPEISQMFGELMGLMLAQHWLDSGAPAPFVLAEAGPGRGTLMADALRATRGVPGFHAAMQLWLIEASPRLRAMQRDRLRGHEVHHAGSIADLPELPLWLIGNEFLDALPIRQFTRGAAAGWHETLVGEEDGRLTPGLGPEIAMPEIAHRLATTPKGRVVEYCPALAPIIGAVQDRLIARGGMALFIDYGAWDGHGDSFQALRHHQSVDPFQDPGLADLTAHVDFAEVARAAPRLRPHFAPQGAVLARLGIAARAEVLARSLSGAALDQHLAALKRLTLPAEMGELFKMLALCPPDAPEPAGFS